MIIAMIDGMMMMFVIIIIIAICFNSMGTIMVGEVFPVRIVIMMIMIIIMTIAMKIMIS